MSSTICIASITPYICLYGMENLFYSKELNASVVQNVKTLRRSNFNKNLLVTCPKANKMIGFVMGILEYLNYLFKYNSKDVILSL